MPNWLAMSVHHSDGSVTRWGPDEYDTDRLLNDLSFTTSTPGGFKDCTASLLRGIQPQPDESILDTVVVYGPGGRVAWEGRVQQLPRETGDGDRMTPQAVGRSAELEYTKSFREVYVDRDQSRWAEPPLERRLLLAGASTGMGKVQTGPNLVWAVPNEALPNAEAAELWYDAGPGITIKTFYYDGQRIGAFTNFEAPTLYSSASRDLSGPGSNSLTLDDTVRSVTITTAARYLMLRVYTSSSTTPAVGHLQSFDAAAVYGDHGLTLRSITGQPPGVYASDVIADVVARAAPGLAFTTGSTGTIQATSFAIPQAAYPEPTTAAAVIQDVNKYHGWDWLIWENGMFYFQPVGSGTEWRARRADGARLRVDGVSADVILNQMFVSYDDGTGRRKLAGPPGSGADVTDATLEDTTVTNPVNAHGITEKSDLLVLSDPTNDAGAIVIGALALYEANAATRRGQLTVTGTLEHPTEGQVPVWRVRAGDTVTVSDLPGDVPRRIIETSYSHRDRTNTLTLDNTPGVLSAMFERLAVATAAFVNGRS